MHRWKRILCLIAGCLLGAGTFSVATAQADDETTIKYRQSVMKGVGGHTGAIFQIVKKDIPHKDHLLAHARALNDLLAMTKDAFKAETSGGKTRAKPKIWTDFAGFEKAAREAEMASAELVVAVDSSNEMEISKKFAAVQDTCKGCHKEYREKKK
jgi:cytochrome c556